MKYEEIKEEIKSLSYRDKLRLAQLLIQLARKEEEEQSVLVEKKRAEIIDSNVTKIVYTVDYVIERILKSKPAKLKSLGNFISAMFQFQGSISELEKQDVIKNLIDRKVIKVEQNKVIYLK